MWKLLIINYFDKLRIKYILLYILFIIQCLCMFSLLLMIPATSSSLLFYSLLILLLKLTETVGTEKAPPFITV